VRLKAGFVSRFKLIWLSSPGAKNIASENQCRPASTKRGVRVVTNVGWDAMDAEVPLTSGAEADGEIVWSWRPDAGVKSAIRSAGDGGKKARSPGSTYKP
jgi:hypothetical protein